MLVIAFLRKNELNGPSSVHPLRSSRSEIEVVVIVVFKPFRDSVVGVFNRVIEESVIHISGHLSFSEELS